MKSLKIIDIILHKNKYGTQMFIVLNRKPDIKYERRGDRWLIGEDSGVFNFYYYEAPRTWRAFAGREFDIPLKGGGVEHAHGQWWDKTPPDYQGLLVETGYGTPDELAKMNVFRHIRIDREMIDEWLSGNEPSNNYHKYDKKAPDFGKHRIVSRWE